MAEPLSSFKEKRKAGKPAGLKTSLELGPPYVNGLSTSRDGAKDSPCPGETRYNRAWSILVGRAGTTAMDDFLTRSYAHLRLGLLCAGIPAIALFGALLPISHPLAGARERDVNSARTRLPKQRYPPLVSSLNRHPMATKTRSGTTGWMPELIIQRPGFNHRVPLSSAPPDSKIRRVASCRAPNLLLPLIVSEKLEGAFSQRAS